MGQVIIAPLGGDLKSIKIVLDELDADTIFFICHEDHKDDADKVTKFIKNENLESKCIFVAGDIWEETFKAITNLANSFKGKEILVNVSSGEPNAGCASTCAAFVNGIKAFRVVDNKIRMLPVLKFSYYKLIPEKKMEIIRFLADNNECCGSMEELSKKLKMSLPLVSYHINGTLKADGLKTMGLVETEEVKGKVKISLTKLGKLISEGYIIPEANE